MSNEKVSKKDLYYTTNQDWINFQGRAAYVGIGSLKLTGFKKVNQLFFQEPNGFCKQGDIIATIVYHDYQVELRMPVDGKLLKFNETLKEDPSPILQQPDSTCWLALIAPLRPYERQGLLSPQDYQLNGKNKYAK